MQSTTACLSSLQRSRNHRHNSCCTLLWLYLSSLATNCSQQALSNASVHDFLIVEYNGEIGGRVAHTTFGNSSAAKAYTIELGANWVRRAHTLIRLKLTWIRYKGFRQAMGQRIQFGFWCALQDCNLFKYMAHNRTGSEIQR
jgi:hypothetical protein